MSPSKAHIIAQLQKEILPLQGYKPLAKGGGTDCGLGPIKYSFPDSKFPVGAVHEFFCNGVEDSSATSGFVAGILSSLMQKTGASLWISSSRLIFPPALKLFGIEPEKMIFLDVQKEKDKIWVMEEALKCEGLSAVIGEMQEISFTASRRLQLAVEQSRVTAFLIRKNPKNVATACLTRWRITPIHSNIEDDLPGLGFPKWNVELLKVRNGKTGTWQLEWAGGRFKHVYKLASIEKVQQRKAG
jgi:protein ImuA